MVPVLASISTLRVRRTFAQELQTLPSFGSHMQEALSRRILSSKIRCPCILARITTISLRLYYQIRKWALWSQGKQSLPRLGRCRRTRVLWKPLYNPAISSTHMVANLFFKAKLILPHKVCLPPLKNQVHKKRLTKSWQNNEAMANPRLRPSIRAKPTQNSDQSPCQTNFAYSMSRAGWERNGLQSWWISSRQ